MAVVKIIELVGSSKDSTDDAAKQALTQAQSSLRNIRAVDIVSTGIRGENLDEYRAHVRVAFLIEGTDVHSAQLNPRGGPFGRFLWVAGEGIDTEGTEHGGELPPERLAEMLEAGEVELIDVRRPHEWDAGRIPGARRVEGYDLPAEYVKLAKGRSLVL